MMRYLTFKNLKTKALLSFIFFTLGFFYIGSSANALTCDYDPSSGEVPPVSQIVCPIVRGINIAILIAGVVFTMYVIISAYKFFTSVGDPKATEGARKTLTYAVIGFIIVISSYTIFTILTSSVLGINISFNIFEGIQTAICDLLTESANKPIVDNCR
jgi:small-conductance mechanosensitive channel